MISIKNIVAFGVYVKSHGIILDLGYDVIHVPIGIMEIGNLQNIIEL